MDILIGTPEELQHKSDNSSNVSTFLENGITTLYFCSAFYKLFMFYVQIANQFTAWHTMLISIAWVFIMTDVALIFSLNVENKYLGYKTRLWYHRVALTVSLTALAYSNRKRFLNQGFIKTWSGFFGLVALICYLPICLTRILTLFNVNLKKNKILDDVNEITSYFGAVSVTFSIFFYWLEGNIIQSNNIFKLCFFSVMFLTASTLAQRGIQYFRLLLPTRS